MNNKKIVVALGHNALGSTFPEQKAAVKKAAAAIADLVEAKYQVVITHSNGPQVGMIHAAMTEYSLLEPDNTVAPMSICSAMSQGYIGYDLQNALAALLAAPVPFVDALLLVKDKLKISSSHLIPPSFPSSAVFTRWIAFDSIPLPRPNVK